MADPDRFPWFPWKPPFGLDLVLRSTEDRLNGTPLSGYTTKKAAAVAHLSMLQQNIRKNKSSGLVRHALSLKTIENGRGFNPKRAWLLNFARNSTPETH